MTNGYTAWDRFAAAHRAECWERRQRQLELENESPAGEPHPTLRTSEPIFKNVGHARPQAAEQTTEPMTEEERQAWSTWAHSLVTNRLNAFADERMLPLIEAVADELGALTGKAAREQDLEIQKLKDEIAGLRADLQVSQAIVRNNIAMLPTMRRRNAA